MIRKTIPNNTIQFRQYRPANKSVFILEKLYYFRDDPEKTPIHKVGGKPHNPNGWIDSCTFYLCELAEKYEGNPNGDVSENSDDDDDDDDDDGSEEI
jgi:hypothetical protein